jgi:hypothetical protein
VAAAGVLECLQDGDAGVQLGRKRVAELDHSATAPLTAAPLTDPSQQPVWDMRPHR